MLDPEFEQVLAAMGDPAFYLGAPTTLVVLETHISWVFLAGERAYKLKKPVVFAFLDYGTAQRRREMCELEVELNRRLAPDIYLGVRAIVRRGGALELGGPGPDAIEHVVEMRRFDEADTLAARVVTGRITAQQIAAVGGRLARFHAASTPSHRRARGVASVLHNADGNFEGLLESGTIEHRRVLAAQRFTDAFLAANAAALTARMAEGRVRDGHGDLRAEHVVIGDDVQIVDCAEFDAGLRKIDVGADLAFLVMDLARLARPDLGRVLVDAYRSAGGDPGTDQMIAFHAAIRAWVRAKVALLVGDDLELAPDRRAAAVGEALGLLALGEQLAWQARLPLTVIVCGPPASGKSDLARALSETSGLPVVGSDVTRKRLAGIAPTERAPRGAYGAQATALTYAEVGRRAVGHVGAQGGAIIDVAFGRSRDRATLLAELSNTVLPVVFECRAPASVLQARARAREREVDRISDAGPEIAARLRADFEPLEDDVTADRHFVLRTDRPEAQVLEDLVAMLDQQLARSRPA